MRVLTGGVVSALAAWHATAVLLGAIPPLRTFVESGRRDAVTGPSTDRGPAWAFDAGFQAILPAFRMAAAAADKARPVVGRYLALTGTRQSWSMFGDPPRSDRYMRVRYYIRSGKNGRIWSATELVWPAQPENRIRLVKSFVDSFRDKALDNSLDRFREHRRDEAIRPDAQPQDLPDDLAPAARYFARRFARARQLELSGERIVRIEVWGGSAPTHAPGAAPTPRTLAARSAALQAYYDGPVERRWNVPPFPQYLGGELEEDISWRLEYFEEP